MISLSTGANVPEINELTQGQLWQLCLIPIEEGKTWPYRNMPKDLIDYLKAAQNKFFHREGRK